MIVSDNGEKPTPKKIAIRIANTMLNIVNIDNEIEDFQRLTKRERQMIHDQYWKLYDRIEKRYL